MTKKKIVCVLYYLLSFFIPFLIIMLAYIGLHIEPFGSKTLLISDANTLYLSDLSYISRALHGKADLVYSFELGIGMNLLATHGNILNPINIIAVLYDITSYAALYSIIIAIDMSLCGLTMYIFLSSVYESKNSNLIFSTVYALIGFNVAYCFQINFFIGVELLPLIALGINKILRGRGPWLYLVTLSCSILSSFYFGYILCIASVTLFLSGYCGQRKNILSIRRKIWTNYVGASLTAGLLPAVVWLPALLSLAGGRMEQNSWLDYTFGENMSILEMGSKLFIGANNIDQLINGLPNIFCGTFVVFLVLAFFIDRRNDMRIKIVHAVPLIFYLITFYIKALAMAMQGFTDTNWFNYRYSFAFSFLLILTACEEFARFREISAQDFRRSCIAYIAFALIIFSRRYSYVNGGEMLLGILILALIVGAIYWNKIDDKRAPKRVMVMLILILCSIESYANLVICTYNILEWATDSGEFQQEVFYGSALAEGIQKADGSFYRMANEHSFYEQWNNDPRLYGYNGVNYFGSCEKLFVYQGLTKLGHSWWGNRMWYGESETPAFDALLGLKYVIARRDLEEVKGYEKLLNLDEDTIFRNSKALPIGMFAAQEEEAISFGRNPFQNQNDLWKSLAGLDDDVFTQENDIVFTYHEGIDGKVISYDEALEFGASVLTEGANESDTNSSANGDEGLPSADMQIESERYIECLFTVKQDGPIYAYTGIAVDDDTGYSMEPMRYVGTFHKGDIVKDIVQLEGDMTVDLLNAFCAEYYVAYSNDGVLARYSEILQSKAGSFEKLTDSHLVGDLVADEKGRLFFTIPYDEGWTLLVDGVEAKLEKTADLFMAAPIDAGAHTYELIFRPKGMRTGLMISVGALALLIILIAINVCNRKHNAMRGSSVEL